MINFLYSHSFYLFVSAYINNKKNIIYIVTITYIMLTLLASYFQFKLVSPQLWKQENLYLKVAFYIAASYAFSNLAKLLANLASSFEQIISFTTLDNKNIQRSHLERDIRQRGEIHNIFSSLLSVSINMIILCVALFNIGFIVFNIYLLFILVNWYIIKTCHKYIRNAGVDQT